MVKITDNSLIKKMMPRQGSRFHQGVIPASECAKLFESCRNEDIIYRSGLELKFIRWCESSPRVLRWASEPFRIEYMSRLDNRAHGYYPDFIIETTDGKAVHKYIVEIKPYSQTLRPKHTASVYEKRMWVKNQDKWKAAVNAAGQNENMGFIIVTERFFG